MMELSNIFLMLLYSFSYVLKSLKAGEAVVVIDYKMKLELGMHSREIQHDWYGKHGISLHSFYVIMLSLKFLTVKGI